MISSERIRNLTPEQRSRLLEKLNPNNEGGSETELVAYVVFRPKQEISVEELQAHCRTRLPEIMIPVRFMPLAALPQHPNGKVNRAALPEPDIPPKTTAALQQPQNETERRLAQIWAELLHLEDVGTSDNFFRLGGHSLLALQVMARVRDTFKVSLPLKALFDSPTVGGLAAAITKATASPQPSIPRAPRNRPAAHNQT